MPITDRERTVMPRTTPRFARVGGPYPAAISADVFKNSPRHNYIDNLVLDKLEKLHIEPSGHADDNIFIRRAFLDAMGILPAPDDVERFVQDKDPNKRSKLVDEILARDEFVDYWAYKWSDLLRHPKSIQLECRGNHVTLDH